MSTVTELRARRDARICYLLAIEGLPYMWTTDAEIAGTDWIGQDDTSRTVLPGLQMPKSVMMKIDTENGILAKGSGAKFSLLDTTGILAAIFGQDPTTLSQAQAPQFGPDEDPAPATIFDGVNDIPTPNKWIGQEAIGPSGERRYYPLFPDQVLPGEDHYLIPSTYPEGRPTGIAEAPFGFEGLRVALWRLVRDDDGPSTGAAAWPKWSLQHAGGSLLWWGKIKSGIKSNGGIWSIPCSGPGSWLNKLLNVNSTSEWTRIDSALRLDEDERYIWVALQKWKVGVPLANAIVWNGKMIQSDNKDPGYSYDEYPTLSELATTLRNAIDETITRTGPGGDGSIYNAHAYDEEETVTPPNVAKGAGSFDANTRTFQLQISKAADYGTFELHWMGVMLVIVHEKVLKRMGFDPYLQGRDDFNYLTSDNTFQARKLNPWDAPINFNGTDVTVPTTGYWLLTLTTKANDSIYWNQKDCLRDNGNAVKEYYRLTDESVVLDTAGQQRILLDSQSDDPLYLQGVLGRPVTGQADFDVDSTRWFAIRGPYARVVDEGGNRTVKKEQYTTVCKMSWNNIAGQPSIEGGEINRTMWLEYFDRPRKWGFDHDPIEDGTWAALAPDIDDAPGADDQNVFRVTPLATWVYGGTNDPKEQMGAVLSRLLLSTGTASWPEAATEEQPGAGPTGGVNEPVDAGVYGDLEIADLGLAIPYQMVDVDSFKFADVGTDEALRRVRVARHGPVQAREVIGELIGAAGWSLGLRGKKYGLFRLFDPLDPQDIEAVIDESAYHHSSAQIGKGFVSMNTAPVYPINRVEIRYFSDPLGGDPQYEAEFGSRDLTARIRTGENKPREVLAPFLEHDPTKEQQPWLGFAKLLWANQAARWYALPNRLLSGVKVPRQVGQDLMPGSVVRVTNPWPANPDGGYGWIDHIGRVIRVTHGTSVDPIDTTVTLDIIVGSKSLREMKFFAPIARVIDDVANAEDRYNPGSHVFKCYKDAFQTGSTLSDVLAFQEPAFSEAGGDALIWGYQFDGLTWSQNFSGNVQSVDGSSDTITLTGAITGTFYDRMYTILVMAPYEEAGQAAWVQELFSVVTRYDGTFGGAGEGWKLES